MALLQRCGRLIRSLSVLRVKCQVFSATEIQKNNEIRGYVTSNLLKKQIQLLTRRQKGTESNLTKKILPAEIEKSDGDLELYLDLVNSSLREEQVPYEHIVTSLKLLSQSIDKNNRHSLNYEKISESPEIFLLSCCGEKLWTLPLLQRQKLAQEVWNFIANHVENLTLEHYHTLLTICAENRQEIDPALFIKQMKVPPDEQTWILLMKIAGKTGDLEASSFVLAKMKELDFTLNFETLTALLDVYCTKGNVEQALETLNSVFNAGIKPGEEMWSCLAKGYAVKGDLESLTALTDKFNFNTQDLSEIVAILCNSCTNEEIIDFLRKLSSEKLGKIGDNTIFIASIINLIKSNKSDKTAEIIRFFIDKKQNIDVKAGKSMHINNKSINEDELTRLIVFYLKTLVSTDTDEKTIFDELFYIKNSGKFEKKSVDEFLINLLEESLNINRKELTYNILREFISSGIEIREHYFWPLLAKSSNEEEIFDVIKKTREFRVKINSETLESFILPNMNTTPPEMALKKLTNVDFTVATALTALTCHLLNCGRIREASAMMASSNARLDFKRILGSLIKSSRLGKNVESLATILEKAPRDKDYAGKFLQEILFNDGNRKLDEWTLRSILEEFRQRDILISMETAEIVAREVERRKFLTDFWTLMDPIVNNRLRQSKSEKFKGIPHPRDMNIEELEAHLIELRSKNMNTRGVLRKLFMKHCKAGNLDRVELIRAELKAMGEALQPGMKALLFTLYVDNGRIGEVCNIILDLQMNHPQFKIDAFKILKASKVLVEQGKIETALEIIANSGTAMHVANFESFLLLDTIARSERYEMLERTLEILTNGNYCELSSEILGTLMRPAVIRKQWSSVVRMMEEFVEIYSAVPLKQEVLSGLIEQGEVELVDKVVKCIERIHGKDAAVQHLIIAYGRHGKIEKLKELFEASETSKVPKLYFSKSATVEMKAQVLSNIILATQGIQMDLQTVYEPLLLTYLELGNREAVDDLLRTVQEDPAPSQIFRQKLKKIVTSWRGGSQINADVQ